MENTKKRKIDPATTVIPFIVILALCTLFVIKPEGSTNVIGIIRGFLGDTLGLYYLIIGLGILLVAFWIAFSDIGKIRLGGKDEKPKYNFFTWGSMIFTCGLAADILFYSFVEWIYYSQETHVADLGSIQEWASSMPLLSTAITKLFGFPESKWLTIITLVIICFAYTIAVITGMKGVSYMAKLCMWVFGALLFYVLIFGGKTFYILETGFSALGNMVQNFIGLSTYTDPLRENSFPQNWTIFYWSYWLVWCVASPFFMGSVSRGRTVKQVILGSFIFGMSATLVSFVILGNFGLGMQLMGKIDVVSFYEQTGNLYEAAIEIIKTLPCYQIVLVLLIISMIAFYATSFDSITLVASAYSYKQIGNQEEASNRMKLFWAILLIMLPIALIFNESSMSNLQSVSIIAAFPIAIVIIMIIASFIKDAKRYIKNEKTKQ